jgi:hypothetical protein
MVRCSLLMPGKNKESDQLVETDSDRLLENAIVSAHAVKADYLQRKSTESGTEWRNLQRSQAFQQKVTPVLSTDELLPIFAAMPLAQWGLGLRALKGHRDDGQRGGSHHVPLHHVRVCAAEQTVSRVLDK